MASRRSHASTHSRMLPYALKHKSARPYDEALRILFMLALSKKTLLQLCLEELCHLTEEVVAGVASEDAVVAVGIEEFAEVLVCLNERL